jgi:F0F1-type ATP synthase assembly protein I
MRVFELLAEEKKEDKYSFYKQLGILTTIPIILAVGPILGYFVGNYLDQKLSTSPYLMIIFIIFGFIASGKQVYNMVVKSMKEMEKR